MGNVEWEMSCKTPSWLGIVPPGGEATGGSDLLPLSTPSTISPVQKVQVVLCREYISVNGLSGFVGQHMFDVT